eukprot:Clim_evm14s108 gene=Clim_evmTU14s108
MSVANYSMHGRMDSRVSHASISSVANRSSLSMAPNTPKLDDHGNALWVENMWGSDEYLGYQKVLAKVKAGKANSKQFLSFLKAKAQLEEQHSKKLTMLAKQASTVTEEDSVGQAWDQFLSQTEAQANVHLGLAKALLQLESLGTALLNKQTAVRKELGKRVQQAQNQRTQAKNNHDKALKNYQMKHMEDKRQKRAAAAGGNLAKKEWHARQKKATKAGQTHAQAKGDYEKAVGLLEQSRINWITETARAYTAFQALEEDRQGYIRQQMWDYTNALSESFIANDQACENIRLALEACNVQEDMRQWQARNATGQEKPPQMHAKSIEETMGDLNMSSLSISSTPTGAHHHEVESGQEVYADFDEDAVPELDEDQYFVVGDFDARRSEELSVRGNQVIRVLERDNEDFWTAEADGMVGLVPVALLAKFE